MKLWVDDIRPAPNEDWTVARTVTSAIRALNRFDFEEVSLDHDISHQVTVGKLGRPYPCEECFCAVAYYLASRLENEALRIPIPKVTMHTSNPVGAKEMAEILLSVGIKSEIRPTGMVANRLEMEI